MKKKEVSDIIYEATRNWDMNPLSRLFADELAAEIIKAEKRKIK